VFGLRVECGALCLDRYLGMKRWVGTDSSVWNVVLGTIFECREVLGPIVGCGAV